MIPRALQQLKWCQCLRLIVWHPGRLLSKCFPHMSTHMFPYFILVYDVGGTCARSIVIITFTIISICGFVLETDRGLYEMILGCVQVASILTPVLIAASKSTSWQDASTTHLVLPCVQLDHEFARSRLPWHAC